MQIVVMNIEGIKKPRTRSSAVQTKKEQDQ